MSSSPKDKEFLAIQKVWYRKLEREGFNDIEQDEEHLKIWDGHRIKAKYTQDTFQAKEEYFWMAGRFLNSHKFKTTSERLIWEAHSQGMYASEIVKLWKKKGRRELKLHIVHKIVSQLSKEMLQCLTKKT